MNKKISVTISDIANETWDFKGSRHLLTFLRKETDFWKEQEESMGDVRGNKIHQHISSHTRLDSCISEVEGFIEQSNMKDEELSKRIHQTLSIGLNNIWLWSGHPFSEVFVQCNRNYGLQAAEAFIKTVTQKQIEPYFLDYVRNDANSFFGFVLACEFLRKDVDVFKRRNAEKASLDRLRRQYVKWYPKTGQVVKL